MRSLVEACILHIVRPLCRLIAPPVAATRNWPSSTNTPAQNFKTMRLISQHFQVDDLGGVWTIETRQCPYTGIILRHTRRISA